MTEADGFEMIAEVITKGFETSILNENIVNNLGYAALAEKDMNQAEALMRANVKAHPDSANVYDSLGEVLENRKNLKEALKNYQRAVELGKDSSNLNFFQRNLERVQKALAEET